MTTCSACKVQKYDGEYISYDKYNNWYFCKSCLARLKERIRLKINEEKAAQVTPGTQVRGTP